MTIDSPLAKLCKCLLSAANVAAEDPVPLRTDANLTCTALIDPILSELGWDLSGASMVLVDPQENRNSTAGYLLLNSLGSPVLAVRVKPLGTDLNQPHFIEEWSQHEGVQKAATLLLTDGIVWQHYQSDGPRGFTCQHSISLLSDPLIEYSAYLMQQLDAARIWSGDFSISPLARQIFQLIRENAILQKFAGMASIQLDSPATTTPVLQPTEPATVPRTSKSSGQFIPIKSADFRSTKPVAAMLPDGSVIRVKSWRDILRETCKFVLRNAPNLRLPVPDYSGRKRKIFDTQKPSDDIAYIVSEYKGTRVYIYLNYDGDHTLLNTDYVVRFLPEPLRNNGVLVSVTPL